MIRFIASLAFIIMVTLFTIDGFAQRIPDYSLSPEETARQPSTTGSSATYQQYQRQNNFSDPGLSSSPLLPNDATHPSKRFMDGYCDRNFRPAIASDPRYANLGACLQQQKEQVCSQFQQLPDDVKTVLDETIDCMNNLINGENPDDAQAVNMPTTCSDTDSTRLQLLKKYWRDQNTAYSLVFLPDDVLDSSSKCLRGGH